MHSPSLYKLRVIWAALLISQFIYGYGLYIVTRQNSTPTAEPSQLIPVLGLVAMLHFMAAIFLPRFLLKTQKEEISKSLNRTDLMSMDFKKQVEVFSTPFIIRLALFESVALFGFVIAFTTKNIEYYAPFMAVSFISFLVVYPTVFKIRKAFE